MTIADKKVQGIKARHGSITPLRAYQAGGAIERLITEDMPLLIKVVEAAQQLMDELEISYPNTKASDQLLTTLLRLEGETFET